MNKGSRNILLILLVIVLVALMADWMRKEEGRVEDLSYSEFLGYLDKKQLYTDKEKPLLIKGSQIEGYFYKDKEGTETVRFKSYIPYPDSSLLDTLNKSGIAFYKGVPQEGSLFWRSFITIIPWVLFLGFIYFIMMRQVQNNGNRAMNFGRSRAKMSADSKNKVNFKNVAGIKEAKEELVEVVDFLKEPKKFAEIGAKIPRGVLLVGPPGTGKTLLARAVAGEAGVPFFSISGSDFVEMFVGVGASRVRDLFSQAKKQVPCIVFIDEIDAVGRLRGAGLGGGHDEREQTLNQLLVEMDGFEENEGVIVIAATNRADVLDPALLRPGRFDRQVVVDVPDVGGREDILKIHSEKVPLEENVDLSVVARGTPGFTGADLSNLINEAALLAARNNKKKVGNDDLDMARDKVLMGPERKSFIISDEERAVIAYHEAGHAILGELLEHADPIHKVTIIPRGRALGLTQNLPEHERYMRSKNYWIDAISVLLGGRLAEVIQYKDVTTGASNDIERATAIARKMVMEWGMSDKVGPIHLSGNESGAVFLGKDYARPIDHSEAYAKIVDEEVKVIIDNSYKRANDLLQKNWKYMTATAEALLERETITGNELRQILAGKKLPPMNKGEEPTLDAESPALASKPARAPRKPRAK